ncbi:MAG TPA: LemA family protein [Roseimicrobium sp.]|nr:LemA family protein [Roseimicrobium sp.]
MNNGSPVAAELLPWLGPLFSLITLFFALRAGRRHRLVNALPTSMTTGVFIGLSEVKGTAESSAPLTSYLALRRCLWYQWSIEEHWSRTVTETYTDSNGRTRTRTRRESGWTTVDSGGEEISFYLKDDEGVLQILPGGADVEPVTVFDETCTPLNPLYYGKGPALGVPNSDFRRRFSERAIPLHATLYVMGQARERSDVVAAEIAADDAAPMFLISTRSEEQVSSSLRWKFWGLSILGMILTFAGFLIRDLANELPPERNLILYLAAAAIYVFIAFISWAIMVFNSLVDLRQRVNQGWSQVDVQLKRRHDLINNLVAAVTGLRDHESNLQTELASLRSQLGATAPGVAGADFHGVRPTLIAIAERYPDLKAQESFSLLQDNLIDTEQRIALARGYFNEIASHYNARLEIVPDRFLAQLARLQPRPLLAAADFERAAVEVNFAD